MTDPQILIKFIEDEDGIHIMVSDSIKACEKDGNINIIVPQKNKSLVSQKKKVKSQYEVIEFDCQIKSSNDSMQNELFTDDENTFTNNSNIFSFIKYEDKADIDYYAQQENSEKFDIILSNEIQEQCESAKKFQRKEPKDVELSFVPQLDKGHKIKVKFINTFKGLNLESKKFFKICS